jgi:GDSL-like Lipase/Acylhydrolase family
MRSKLIAISLGLFATIATFVHAEDAALKDPYFAAFHPKPAPAPQKNFLKAGDQLAICGDSITEQKKYSRIMETYLTVCVPELNISVRQYGWGGEKAPGFLKRMTNDCLRFKPTVATTCYGMNDHGYRPYTNTIGDVYRTNQTEIVESFKAHGTRVILGSSGCVGKNSGWVDKTATKEQLNLNLCELRNIDIDIAAKEKVGFADVFWPMLVAEEQAHMQYGTNYSLCGKDGVHPDWAGHLVMAYAFLHSFGLSGDIGTFMVDLKSGKAQVTAGHDLGGFKDGELTVTSHRYPFCIGDGDVTKHDNIRSGTTLVPFDQELDRLMLVVKHAKAKSYKVTWSSGTNSFTVSFSDKQLAKGVNLAEAFPVNPFTEAFNKVDEAVGAKQAYETTEIKKTFRSDEAKADMEGTAAKAEQGRDPLAAAIKTAFVPVTHTIKIVAE